MRTVLWHGAPYNNGMAEGTGASFIPKNTTRVKKPRTSRRIYVFSYISYILFFGTLLTVAGTYLYSRHIENQMAAVQEQLASEQARFSQSDIEQVRALEKRLIVAERLLEETNAPSRIFDAMEATVVNPVRFVNFSYLREPDNNVVMTFAGLTDTFDAAIFQRELMEAVPGLDSLDVAEFSYSELGSGDDSGAGIVGDQLTMVLEATANASIFAYEADEPAVGTTPARGTTTVPAAATSTNNTDATAATSTDQGTNEPE